MAKPWSTSHIGFLASEFTDLRISGAVKEELVKLMLAELDKLVPSMEDETLSKDPERKTLDDPQRTRLNYNRTRELMIERISKLDSVGSAAVQKGVEHLETFLSNTVRAASEAAAVDRTGTIKPRHLEKVLRLQGHGVDIAAAVDAKQQIEEDDPLGEAMSSGGQNVLTPTSLRRMAREFAGMPVTDAALHELLELHYDVVDQTEAGIRESIILGNSADAFIQRLSEMKSLMMLGWMKRMLKRSAEYAKERGYKRIDIEQVVQLDPFQI
jgi:histone H3/H4